MDIEFIEDKDEKVHSGGAFIAVAQGEMVGKALVYHRYGTVVEIGWLYQTDAGRKMMTFAEYAEAFFAFLKTRGCTELIVENESDELENFPGFKLEDWDNSGWYPKYYFHREL